MDGQELAIVSHQMGVRGTIIASLDLIFRLFVIESVGMLASSFWSRVNYTLLMIASCSDL